MLSLIIDSRIDGVNEGSDSVLRTFEMIRKLDIGTFICIMTLANLQLPLCKVALLKIIGVQTHVDLEMKNFDMLPENRALQGSANNLSSRTFLNDRQDLVKIASKNHRHTPKKLVRFQNVFQSVVNSFM